MVTYAEIDPKDCEFIPVAGVEDIPPGERLLLEIDYQPLAVFNIAGHYYCIADICSHDSGPLGEGDLEDFHVICPRHGARFDIRNGRVLSLPAVDDIPSYPVRVVNGMIEIGLPPTN